MRKIYWLLAIFAVLGLSGCARERQAKEVEYRRSFKNFIASVDEIHTEGLKISVFFPGVSDYHAHVQELLLAYMDDLRYERPLTFDPQGVVLTRFLGMSYHNYIIKEVKQLNEQDISLRLSISFNYDSTLKQAHYEKGTEAYIPTKPFGHAYKIIIGGDIPVPREQLKYLELDVVMRKTNNEGFWQIRTCQLDEASIQWETSIENEF